jgi:hypothetical protein
MKIGKYIEDSQGDLIGFEYENGFIFKGEFNVKRKPIFGEILNSDGKRIYYGQIIGEIFDLFEEYNRTGLIKQKPFQ